jgi:hypothetical protein
VPTDCDLVRSPKPSASRHDKARLGHVSRTLDARRTDARKTRQPQSRQSSKPSRRTDSNCLQRVCPSDLGGSPKPTFILATSANIAQSFAHRGPGAVRTSEHHRGPVQAKCPSSQTHKPIRDASFRQQTPDPATLRPTPNLRAATSNLRFFLAASVPTRNASSGSKRPCSAVHPSNATEAGVRRNARSTKHDGQPRADRSCRRTRLSALGVAPRVPAARSRACSLAWAAVPTREARSCGPHRTATPGRAERRPSATLLAYSRRPCTHTSPSRSFNFSPRGIA